MVAQIDRTYFTLRPWKIWPRLVAYLLFEGRPLTTRGRWVNPIVFAGYRIWARSAISKPVHDPIFILGVGRSGTTILGTILSMHKDVGYLNEPKALWHAALGNDDLIGSYSKNTGQFRMSASDASPLKIKLVQKFYRSFLAISFCKRVVDKYPEHIFRAKLLDCIFPNARKIVIIRNGMDVCRSIENWSLQHSQNTDQHSDNWWGRDQQKWHALINELVAPDPAFRHAIEAIKKFEKHTDMAAVEWIVTMREALQLKESGNSSYTFVRYDELISYPEKTLGEILDRAGLRPDPKMVRYAKKTLVARPKHSVVDIHPAISGLFFQTMEELGYHQSKAA